VRESSLEAGTTKLTRERVGEGKHSPGPIFKKKPSQKIWHRDSLTGCLEAMQIENSDGGGPRREGPLLKKTPPLK